MKLKTILFIIITGISTHLFACLNAYQFKVFPVGVYRGQIVSVDVEVIRTSVFQGNIHYGLHYEVKEKVQVLWILRAYRSVYDKNQKLISSVPLDTIFTIQKDYTNDLQQLYSKGFDRIKSEFPDIELFRPYRLTFCGYRQKCRELRVKNDSLNNVDIIEYQGVEYPVKFIRGENYYNLGYSSVSGEDFLTHYYISSYRIYKANNMELIVTHFGTGHEISMGWITDNPDKKSKDEGDIVIYAKEYVPDIPFKDIKTVVYKEPLLHHGYGFDVFVVRKNMPGN